MRNPFFQEGPNHVRTLGCLFLALAVPIAVCAILLYAPFMQYRDVQVNGLTTLNRDTVQNTAWDVLRHRAALVLPGTHIALARLGAIERDLRDTYHFDELTMRREGRTLRIDAVERITEIAWKSQGATYLVDLEGTALQAASAEATAMVDARLAQAAAIPFAAGLQPSMPIITDATDTAVTLGASVIPSDVIAQLLALDEGVRHRSLLPVGYTFTESQRLWVAVQFPETVFYIDLVAPINETLEYVDAFLREHRDDLARYAYVDVRFANHIYTKAR